MRGPNTDAFKQGFLNNLVLSLQACSRSSSPASSLAAGAMSDLQERKRAIKSSADIAMATARGAGARWPQALLVLASSTSRPPCELPDGKKVQRCKRIVMRRCCHRRRRDGSKSLARTVLMISSREIARRMVRKRTKFLRRMIPGGEFLDEVSLLREAMDYVAHLHAQVDVLRRISKAVQ